ncbi:MAG: hypothetical protein NWF01_06755 [Candidatus Bathyarchaeota archaeon]|nr:hypothetical protein [Candidatus Bathyarchaeota archaeon]
MSQPKEKTQDNKIYPVKTLHDFLFELDREWSKFRNGALIGLISSGILFLSVIWLILRVRHIELGLVGFFLLIIAAAFLGYCLYAMYAQYRFYSRWERRVGLLVKTEQDLLSEKLEDQKS